MVCIQKNTLPVRPLRCALAKRVTNKQTALIVESLLFYMRLQMNLGGSHHKLVFLESDEGAERNKPICVCGMSVASGAQHIQTQLASLAVICENEFNRLHAYLRCTPSARAKHGIHSITHVVRSLVHLCLVAYAK